MATALSDTIGETVVNREYLDLRLAELKADLMTAIAEPKAEVLRRMFGAVGLQTLAILGGMAALFRLLR